MEKIPDYALAQQKATDLLKAVNYSKLPIDPLEIATLISNMTIKTFGDISKETNYSIQEISDSLDTTDGDLIFKPAQNKYVLLYNENVFSKNRIRFTQAHELGHYFLNHVENSDNCLSAHRNLNDEEYDVMEKEANYFAKRLLAPIPLIVATIEKISDNILYPYEIATEFGLSDQTTEYVIDNMKNLRKWPQDRELENQFKTSLVKNINSINLTRNNQIDKEIIL